MIFSTLVLFSILLSNAIILLIVLAVYFLPVIIAYLRKHCDIIPIVILNIMFGWTFLGWLAALLWSLNLDVKKEELTSEES